MYNIFIVHVYCYVVHWCDVAKENTCVCDDSIAPQGKISDFIGGGGI